jgi:hypothetical protein
MRVVDSFPVHNWQSPVVVRTEWQSTVETTRGDGNTPGAEIRRLLADRPFRTTDIDIAGFGDSVAAAAQAAQSVRGLLSDRSRVPLFSDFVKLTAATSSGANTLNVTSTTGLRLFVGQVVFIATRDPNTNRWKFETRTLQTVTSSTLTLTAGIGSNYPAGTRVYATIVAEGLTDASLSVLHSQAVTASLRLKEVLSSVSIPGRIVPGTLPPGESTFNGYPILTQPYDWSDLRVSQSRQTRLNKVGLDIIPETPSNAQTFGVSLAFKTFDRLQSLRLSRFFDSRGGRVFPFWFVSPINEIVPIAASGTTITVSADRLPLAQAQTIIGYHVGMVGSTGTTIHRVTAASQTGNTVTLTVAHTITQTGIRRIARAYLCRFDTAELVENWNTDQTFTTTLPVASLPTDAGTDSERLPTIPEIDDPDSGQDPLDPWEPNAGSCAAAAASAVPFFFYPGASPAIDRFSERPVRRAAAFKMPQRVRLRLKNLRVRPDHPDAEGLAERLSQFQSTFTLEYDAALSGSQTSRHWLHVRVKGTSPLWTFVHDMPGGGVPVTRHVWRAVRTYKDADDQTQTIDVRLCAEWSGGALDTLADNGLHGTLFAVHVFDSGLSNYTDGTPVDPTDDYAPIDPEDPAAVVFSKNDPCVWGFIANSTPQTKFIHPALALTGALPTSWHIPIGRAWVAPDLTIQQQERGLGGSYDNRRASCFDIQTAGAPWNVTRTRPFYPNWADPKDTALLNQLGSALVSANALKLTQDSTAAQRGAAWYRPVQSGISGGFSAKFRVRLKKQANDLGGAVALVLQSGSAAYSALGSVDQNGYGGIGPGIAIELDCQTTTGDGGPTPHIAVHASATNLTALDATVVSKVGVTVADLTAYDFEVTHPGGNAPITVKVGGTTVLTSANVNLGTILGPSGITVGITGACTSTAPTAVEVLNFEFNIVGDTQAPATDAMDNAAYGWYDLFSSVGFGAVTLGGDFPESRAFEFVCFESCTPLLAAAPGWNERHGGAIIGDFSGVVSLCRPSGQPQVFDCANMANENGLGSYRAARVTGDALEGIDAAQTCCIPTISRLTYDVQAINYQITGGWDEFGNPIAGTTTFISGKQKQWFLQVDEILTLEQDRDPDKGVYWVLWRAYDPDPTYVMRSGEDSFNGAVAYSMVGSGWTLSNFAKCVSNTGTPIGFLNPEVGPTFDATDLKMSVSVQAAGTAHGFVLRHQYDNGPCIVCQYDPEFQHLEVRAYDDPFNPARYRVAAKTARGPVLEPGQNMEVTLFGSTIRFALGAAQCAGTVCNPAVRGKYGLAAFVGAQYTDFKWEDLGPDQLSVDVYLRSTHTGAGGWQVSYPLTLYPGWADLGCIGCEDGFTSCTFVCTTAAIGYSGSQRPQGSSLLGLHSPIDTPPARAGCGTLSGGLDATSLPLTQAASAKLEVTITTGLSADITENLEVRCVSFGQWYQICTVES